MSGFGIYETLRIFLPGAIGLVILDFVLRVSTGSTATNVEKGSLAEEITDLVETGAAFALLAVVLGLLLYLIDLPDRLRLVKGDKTRNILRPSSRFSTLLEKYNQSVPDEEAYDGRHYLSLFFIFADKYIPDELNKRIYLFGSLFRVFTDIRALLWLALHIGPVSSLALATNKHTPSHLEFDSGILVTILALVGPVVALGISGELLFQQNYHRFASHQPQTSETRTAAPGGFRTEAFQEPGGFKRTTAAALSVNAVAVLMAYNLDNGFKYLAVVVALLGWLFWFSLEIGPPTTQQRDQSSRWYQQPGAVRDAFLSHLGVTASDKPQLPVLYRILHETLAVVPLLLAAALAGDILGRPAINVLSWGVLLLPATLIAAVRKHETRLLSVYGHQNAFLDLSSKGIVAALSAKAGTPAELPTGDSRTKLSIELSWTDPDN